MTLLMGLKCRTDMQTMPFLVAGLFRCKPPSLTFFSLLDARNHSKDP